MADSAPRCPACSDPSLGLPHTCAGSGTWKAAEAHSAGAVDALEEGWPVFLVDIQLRVRSLEEVLVREKLTELVSKLLDDDQVESAHFSIRQEAEPVAA